jgi:hypothetical protein
MVEPTDAILPMLQRIQADIAALTRKVEAQGEVLAQHSEKLDAIEAGVSARDKLAYGRRC